MTAVINAVFPIFALILIGFITAKKRILKEEATNSLNLYVAWLALPAVMFQTTATLHLEDFNHLGYIATLSISTVTTYFLYLFWHIRKSALADLSIDSLTASYSNTGYMGLPLCILVFGQSIIPAIVLSMIVTICILFGIAIVVVELGIHSKQKLSTTSIKVLKSLAKNPLIVAPFSGLAVSLLGIPIPNAILHLTQLLGASASPCALITIGLFLAQTPQRSLHPDLLKNLIVKMLCLPLFTAVLAIYVFDMPKEWQQAAILLAALPVGTGPFMIAKLYNCKTDLVSQAILVSTIISIVSISALIAIFQN